MLLEMIQILALVEFLLKFLEAGMEVFIATKWSNILFFSVEEM